MNSIRPVNPNEPMADQVIVAKHQPQYQNLPSIFMKDKQICVSRWAFEETKDYSERKLLKEYKNLFFYQTSARPINALCGHFLSVDFISEDNLSDELKYTNRVFYRDTEKNELMFISPIPMNQKNVYRFQWQLSDEEIERALESNSVFIYQFNLRNLITPIYVSPFCDIVFVN